MKSFFVWIRLGKKWGFPVSGDATAYSTHSVKSLMQNDNATREKSEEKSNNELELYPKMFGKYNIKVTKY